MNPSIPPGSSFEQSLLAVIADPKAAKARLDQIENAFAAAKKQADKVRADLHSVDAERMKLEDAKMAFQNEKTACAKAAQVNSTVAAALDTKEARLNVRENALQARERRFAEDQADFDKLKKEMLAKMDGDSDRAVALRAKAQADADAAAAAKAKYEGLVAKMQAALSVKD